MFVIIVEYIIIYVIFTAATEGMNGNIETSSDKVNAQIEDTVACPVASIRYDSRIHDV